MCVWYWPVAGREMCDRFSPSWRMCKHFPPSAAFPIFYRLLSATHLDVLCQTLIIYSVSSAPPPPTTPSTSAHSLCRYSAPDYEWAYAPAPPGGAAGWAWLHRGDAHPQRPGNCSVLRCPVHTGDTRKGTGASQLVLTWSNFFLLLLLITESLKCLSALAQTCSVTIVLETKIFSFRAIKILYF